MEGRYIDTPFLPDRDVTAVVLDGRASLGLMNNLKRMGIHIVKTTCCKEVYDAISYHPDILLHPVASKDIVIAPNVYDPLKDVFFSLGFNPLKGDTVLGRNYPQNIAYNVARLSKFAIHNWKYTDKVLLRLLEENHVELIHVKQGYSKCSICIVNDHAIITADPGIARAVERYGIEALLISPGYISLSGLDYGFIGGISGLLGKNKLAFSGYLRHHPDYGRIMKFLDKCEINPMFLSENFPTDIGSIVPLLQMAS